MKKNIAIVLGATKDHAFAVSTLLIGFKKYNSDLADNIIIFHDGFSDYDKSVILKIFCNTIFIEYTLENLKNKLNMTIEDIQKADHIKKYTHMVFSVYEIFKLLDQFKKILWLDYDIIINNDIQSIFQYPDVSITRSVQNLNDSLGIKDISNFFNVDGYQKYYNSGLILVNDNIDFVDIYNKCYEYTKKFYYTLTMPDQAIISLVFCVTNTKVNFFTKEIFTTYLSDNIDTALMIHGLGVNGKFWSNTISYHVHSEYRENYNSYLSLGGTPYNPSKITGSQYIADFSKKSLMMHFKMIKFWDILYDKIRFKIPKNLNPSLNTSRNYLQFYINGLDKKVHYELIYKNDSYINVAFHIEKPAIVDFFVKNILQKNEYFLYNIKQSRLFNSRYTDKRYSLECVVALEDVHFALTYIYNITKDVIKLIINKL